MRLKKQNNKAGAGILVFKYFNGERKILILLDQFGKLDIPKGHIDMSDVSTFAAAQRECFEETQIFIGLNDLLVMDFYKDDNLTIFCAKTEQEPVLMKNPESGLLEHVRFYWMSPDDALTTLPKYLSNALRWGLKHTA